MDILSSNRNRHKNRDKHNFIASINSKPSILFFDVEMTGGNVFYDEILQFSLIDLYKGVQFNNYIKPLKCTSWKSTEPIHHITPNMVKNCFSIIDYRPKITQLLRQAEMIVGYGIENDVRFMRKNKLFVGRHTIIYDLQKAFSRMYSHDNDMPSLHACANYYTCPDFGKEHNSLTDAYVTMYCFISMFKMPIPHWLEKTIGHKFK